MFCKNKPIFSPQKPKLPHPVFFLLPEIALNVNALTPKHSPARFFDPVKYTFVIWAR